MDRDKIRNTILPKADGARASREERKRIFENFIGETLSQIRTDGREPDAWEADGITYSFGAALCGRCGTALAYANRAIAAPEERAPGDYERTPELPTLAEMEQALDYLTKMEAHGMDYPSHWPDP